MIVIFRKNLRIIILLSSITLITADKAQPPPPRSVNVALETSFFFDPKDFQQNRYLVSNVREFLDKLLEVIDPEKTRTHYRAEGKRRDTKQKLEGDSIENIKNITKTGTSIKNVLEFVKNVGQNFVNLTGNKIAEAVNNIHVELIPEPTNTKNRGARTFPQKFQAKHSKKNIKDIISSSINNWMRRYPEEMKTIMNNTVDEKNPFLNTFARRMNTYYNDEDIKKLKKLLRKFKRHIENNQDTTQVVNELLNNAVFKKYGSLNETTKHALMEDLKMCSEILLSQDVIKSVNHHLAVFTKRSLPKNDKIETGDVHNIDDLTYTNLRRSIDNKLRDTREKNKDNQKEKSYTNEIVVHSSEFLPTSTRKPPIFD